MVYDFTGMRDECYSMYITQNKTLDEIQEHFRRDDWNPSKRAYQSRFKEWDFPQKHVRQHNDQGLQERIRQLWQKNYTNNQMLEILRGEGYEVKQRELSKLRVKDGLMLRAGTGTGIKRKRTSPDDEDREEGGQSGNETEADSGGLPTSPVPALSFEIVVKRQARQAKLMAESAERLRL
ncbi:MAG: hypothetical protein Q9163_006410, partial [Psora crenata]